MQDTGRAQRLRVVEDAVKPFISQQEAQDISLLKGP